MRDAEPEAISPVRLADAYAALADGPIRPIAGGTDLMVALAAETIEPPDRVLDLWGINELRGISEDGADLVDALPLARREDHRVGWRALQRHP